jgi:acylglycerol lipase
MKVFLQGGSMGGLVALQLIRKYPSLFDGAIFLAPLVDVSQDSKPNTAVFYIAKMIKYFNPVWLFTNKKTLAMVEANAGKNNTDEKYEIEFQNDKLNYHGKLRVGTGLAMSESKLLI